MKDCGFLKEVSLLQILKQSAADYIKSFDSSLHVCMQMDIYYKFSVSIMLLIVSYLTFLTPINFKFSMFIARPSLNLNSCSSSTMIKFIQNPIIVHLRMGRSKMWCQTLMFPVVVILTHQSITLGNGLSNLLLFPWLFPFCST